MHFLCQCDLEARVFMTRVFNWCCLNREKSIIIVRIYKAIRTLRFLYYWEHISVWNIHISFFFIFYCNFILGDVLSVLLLIWANIAFHFISLNVMYREAIIIIRLLPLTVYSFEVFLSMYVSLLLYSTLLTHVPSLFAIVEE